MKQLLFEIYNEDSLQSAIRDTALYVTYHKPRTVLFHLYCGVTDVDWIRHITGELKENFAEAGIAGVSSHAEIINGHLTDPVVLLSAMIFESTDAKVACFPDILEKETEYGRRIRNIIDETRDIKAAELLVRGAPVDNYAFL